MREEKIENMDFKALRKEVAYLRDELALFIRKYNDTIMNLDSDNFGKSFSLKQKNMETQIKVTAEGLKTKVSASDVDSKLEGYSTVEQTAESILSNVASVTELLNKEVATLSSSIEANAIGISLIVSGKYTDDLLKNYFTGIEIAPRSIKMIDSTDYGNVYSEYSSDGLRFYDNEEYIQGWAIEPSVSHSGVLNYYVNSGVDCTIGQGFGGYGYGYSVHDMTVKLYNGSNFVVDVADVSDSMGEVKFVGLKYDDYYSPHIYANGQLLATQDWVTENGGGGGTVVAVFG